MATSRSAVIESYAVISNILVIRGHRVLLDSDLAALYQVETKALTRAVRRNVERFPGDFMFQLAPEESGSLTSQFGTLKTGRGKHRKYAPYVFLEQGVAMLSSVLNSERAAQLELEGKCPRPYRSAHRRNGLRQPGLLHDRPAILTEPAKSSLSLHLNNKGCSTCFMTLIVTAWPCRSQRSWQWPCR